MTRPARFLVLRGGAIGDFLLTLPVLQALRDRWPDAWIEVLGYPHVAALALAGGLVDRVDSLERAGTARFFSAAPEFPPEQIAYLRSFDFVISYLHDPTGLVRENLKLAGARVVLYRSPIVESGHAIEHLMKPLESLAVYASGETPSLAVDNGDREAGTGWLRDRGLRQPVLAVHPGSGSPKKNWPADRFAALARRLREEHGLDPLYLLGEADRDVADGLSRLEPAGPVLKEAPLRQVAAVLSACRLYVGNDSGITHLAAALGVPTVALFGPSDAARWGPRGPRVRVIRAPDSDLDELGTEAVCDAVRSLLG